MQDSAARATGVKGKIDQPIRPYFYVANAPLLFQNRLDVHDLLVLDHDSLNLFGRHSSG